MEIFPLLSNPGFLIETKRWILSAHFLPLTPYSPVISILAIGFNPNDITSWMSSKLFHPWAYLTPTVFL